MLRYWILKQNDGKPVGFVRTQNDRTVLHLTTSVSGAFTLFSKTDAVPIMPESETRLHGAEALLGTENGQMTCFAAAPDAAPSACYLEKLSQIYTKEPEPPASPEPVPEISQNSTIEPEQMPKESETMDDKSQIYTIEAGEPDSVSDTARETESFSLLLNRANAFYDAYEGTDDMVQKEDNYAEGIDLFPQAFPGARWRYVTGRGVLPHYEGMWREPGGGAVKILAVPGRAAPRPPRTLWGFTRFMRGRDGAGYWVRLTPLT